MKTIKFGIIGAGLMGREFASAAARWCHLLNMPARPEIIAVCDKNPAIFEWYREHFPSITQYTNNYKTLLANQQVDAVYCAVPHNLHEEIYCAVINSGKHLMGEKPFGIDLKASMAIMAELRRNSSVFARCSSEFPFFPAAQRVAGMIEKNTFGRIIEVNAAFLHSSDLDPNKPLNWKRMVEFNGAYGVMGDLGLHVCHLPFRAGWVPKNVRAILSDIVRERPDGKGGKAPCRTWDNAVLLCETVDPKSEASHGNSSLAVYRCQTSRGRSAQTDRIFAEPSEALAKEGNELFPMTLKMQRIAPGEKNTWKIEVLGTKASARFSTKSPKRLEILEYHGGEQLWQQIDTGYEPAFKTITGGIFEFGFTDAILQMWAAFIYELTKGKSLQKFAGCVTPEEAVLSHKLFTAALESQMEQSVVAIE